MYGFYLTMQGYIVVCVLSIFIVVNVPTYSYFMGLFSICQCFSSHNAYLQTIYCISSKEFLVYLAPHDCGDYEVWVDNRIRCPPDSCYTRFIQPPCMPSLPSDPPNPGCQCIDGYLRNDDRVCIPRDQCVPRKQNHDFFTLTAYFIGTSG